MILYTRHWLITCMCTLLAACATTPPNDIAKYAWLDKLKQGGYVILFRHALTEWTQVDSEPDNLANCATQRNLNAHGRAQGKAIGAGFRALQIPVGIVESSLYCRCLDTARLAFDRVTGTPDLSSYIPVPPLESQRRVQSIRLRVSTPPEPGTNTVLVSHKIMIAEATSIILEEGSAAVFQPNNNGGHDYIGFVPAEAWLQYAKSLSR